MRKILILLGGLALGYVIRLAAFDYWPAPVVDAWFTGAFLAWFITHWCSNEEHQRERAELERKWAAKQNETERLHTEALLEVHRHYREKTLPSTEVP